MSRQHKVLAGHHCAETVQYVFAGSQFFLCTVKVSNTLTPPYSILMLHLCLLCIVLSFKGMVFVCAWQSPRCPHKYPYPGSHRFSVTIFALADLMAGWQARSVWLRHQGNGRCQEGDHSSLCSSSVWFAIPLITFSRVPRGVILHAACVVQDM